MTPTQVYVMEYNNDTESMEHLTRYSICIGVDHAIPNPEYYRSNVIGNFREDVSDSREERRRRRRRGDDDEPDYSASYEDEVSVSK